MAIKVIPSAAPVGAEIQGVNLVDVDAATLVEISQAVDRYSVVVFRHQKLSPQQQLDFTARFGPLHRIRPEPDYSPPGYPDILRVSNVIEDGRPIGTLDAGQYWHSDLCVTKRPPFRSTLYAVEIPYDDNGRALGDTLFSGTAEAHDTLPEDIKARLTGLRAIHDHTKRKMSAVRAAYGTDRDHAKADHPVVRIHPVTGRKGLYVNEAYTTRIVGMDEKESDELLGFLFRHITREEMLYRHHWGLGDVLLWDDCALQHNAIGDYPREKRRLLYRATVAGTEVV